MITDLHTAAWVHTGFEYAGIVLGAWWWRRGLKAQALGGPLAAGKPVTMEAHHVGFTSYA